MLKHLRSLSILLGTFLSVAAAANDIRPSDALTDGEAVQIILTSAQVQIDCGNLAKTISKNEAVLKYSDRLITDHSLMLTEIQALQTRTSIVPVENEMSQMVAQIVKNKQAQLARLQGAEFDIEFMDAAILFHHTAVNFIESEIKPVVQNQDLKDYLSQVLKVETEHLNEAKAIRATLN